MNNFDTSSKIASIDEAIQSVLEKHGVDWKNKQLYSWGYTSGLDGLDIMSVYGKDGSYFKSVDNQRLSNNMSSKFVSVKKCVLSKPHFIMELSTILYDKTAPYNIIVSDMAPDAKLFDGHELHSEHGKWYIGLE